MSFNFQAGWNLIGSFGSNDLMSSVFDSNTFSEIGAIFKYEPASGYTYLNKANASFQQDYGYWFLFKSSGTGTITRGNFSNTIQISYGIGWNLVSHPMNSTELLSVTFGDQLANLGAIFGYSAVSGYQYINSQSSNASWETNKGFWFLFKAPTIITYTGELPIEPEPEPDPEPLPGLNNLIIDSAPSSLDPNNIKNILSFSFPESMVTSSHSKLLSIAYKKISGNITFEVNNDHTNILGPPSGSVPSLADTTYFSINNGNVIALMEDYSVVPSDATELLNQSNGLIVFYTGVSLTADTPIKFAQLTMTNTSSGVLEVTYADSSRPNEFQNHTLNVTGGIIASA